MLESFLATLALLSASCASDAWSAEERHTVESQGMVMHVLSVDDASEAAVLRSRSTDISGSGLRDGLMDLLARKMIVTVTSPEFDGVGIAGPQVGILRRIVAVQRLDKDGEPFEIYPNIEIISFNGEERMGPEGCLSVPGRRGNVLRSRNIDIRYCSPSTLRDTVENVRGFTAVIFQHECDHLDGIIYTDRADSVMVIGPM